MINNFIQQSKKRFDKEIEDLWCTCHLADCSYYQEKMVDKAKDFLEQELRSLWEKTEENKKCEHNFVGTWGSSEPPPNMKCTKCLQEFRF